MKKAVYAGSFNPFTNGHLDIVKKASALFDEVIVCIAVNLKKVDSSGVSFEKKANKMALAIQDCLTREGLTNCKVTYYDGLIADLCKENDIKYLVRGLRNTSDYMYEENIAKINREINPDLTTIYFRATENEVISSTMVRELLHYGKPVDKYVPPEILKNL